MNVVLDTNIIVGAAITPRGPAGSIVAAWRRSEFFWIVSPALFAELERALKYPRVRRYLAWSEEELEDFLALAPRLALLVEPDFTLDAVESDPDDNRLLEAALEGQAEYVVTNDNALLQLGAYEGIAIVSAARFVAILAGGRPTS